MADYDKSDIYIIPVEQLHPNPWNPNEMGETAWNALGQSIVKHGIHLQPLVVRRRDEGFQIIDGEHRYKWACEMGIPNVSAVVIDVDDFQAKKLTQTLNRVRGDDNPVKLKELLDSLLVDNTPDEVIEGMAIANEQELNHLLEDLERQIMNDYDFGEEGTEGLTDDDEIPEDAPTRVKRGDIWQLGRHRVMCGDSTSKEDAKRLMRGKLADMVFTDPPYGVAYVGKTSDSLTIENDDVSSDKLKEFVTLWFDVANDFVRDGAYLLATVPAGQLQEDIRSRLAGQGVASTNHGLE